MLTGAEVVAVTTMMVGRAKREGKRGRERERSVRLKKGKSCWERSKEFEISAIRS